VTEAEQIRELIRIGRYAAECCGDPYCSHSRRAEWEHAVARVYELEGTPNAREI
jgi:hypothetical protein